jgi:hypothetical protein
MRHAVCYVMYLQVATRIGAWHFFYPSSVAAGSYPFIVGMSSLVGVNVAPRT